MSFAALQSADLQRRTHAADPDAGRSTHRPQDQPKHAGLRPSQVPAHKSETAPTSGGLDGINLDISFSTSGTPAAGLQAVQTFMGTRRTDGVKVGTMTWQYQDKTWDGFVDGGVNSPFAAGGAPAHPAKPYYLTAAEVASNVTWDKDHGSIRVTDAPGAAALHDEAHFETAIVAIDADGKPGDRVLKAFKWGWTGRGTQQDWGKGGGTVVAGKPSGVLVRSVVTPEFRNIVQHDYPGYRLA